jgi:hypothetical protein
MNALIIACADGHIAGPLSLLQAELGELDADRLLLPGGPLQLTYSGVECRVALDWVRTQLEIHGNRTIYLVSHQDCGAYERALGGLGFDQQELLERDLRRAKALLETAHPGVDVRAYVIPWDDHAGVPGFGPAEPVE